MAEKDVKVETVDATVKDNQAQSKAIADSESAIERPKTRDSMAKTTEASPHPPEENAPNVQFVGRRTLLSGEVVDMEAPKFLNSGNRKINLPSEEEQKAGFYLPTADATAVRAEYGHLYKEPKAKG
ncbi:MAG TPA: hypothetical protein VNI84_13870 [Pyrinomonadaceae bacterium]|nr:hypothetical protein [Pyrinomonadaceae bacterium]